ncbi:MAG: hypothetical protein NZM12_01160 [Steroidobacteraceae bacterium]|nr:hypothetical protein [Steroidobacteraceae bacterium]MDW8258759.1 hypothetical protein [Gammaproteobacteria bacterium]
MRQRSSFGATGNRDCSWFLVVGALALLVLALIALAHRYKIAQEELLKTEEALLLCQWRKSK